MSGRDADLRTLAMEAWGKHDLCLAPDVIIDLLDRVAAAESERKHEMSGTCWCRPTTSHEDPVTGERVFVHRYVIS